MQTCIGTPHRSTLSLQPIFVCRGPDTTCCGKDTHSCAAQGGGSRGVTAYREDLVDGAKDIEVGGCAHVALVGREAEHCDRYPLVILGLLGQPAVTGLTLSIITYQVPWLWSNLGAGILYSNATSHVLPDSCATAGISIPRRPGQWQSAARVIPVMRCSRVHSTNKMQEATHLAQLMARAQRESILSGSEWLLPLLESRPANTMGSRPPSSSGRATYTECIPRRGAVRK